jgi:hypothetical protein
MGWRAAPCTRAPPARRALNKRRRALKSNQAPIRGRKHGLATMTRTTRPHYKLGTSNNLTPQVYHLNQNKFSRRDPSMISR